jgi:beta-lactamase superfamily II metal-dependent hydrolase
MFRVRMLPAAYGDCLWLEYGTNKKKLRRVLIDGGTPGSFASLREAIEELPESQRRFELLIITHIDSDHIGGSLGLLEHRTAMGVEFGDIWFNGYKHLDPGTADILGGVQGEKLTTAIIKQRLRWNNAFKKRSVVVPNQGKLPIVKLAGGLKLTLLSPTWVELERLRPRWKEEVIKAGLKPGVPATKRRPRGGDVLGSLKVDELAAKPFKTDTTEPNGSSIVVLACYNGARILLGADGQVPVLMKTLPRLDADELKKIRWLKVPHHGSRANLSSELLTGLSCKEFLVSSNGKIYHHPDKETIARIIKRGNSPRLYFNYRTEFNEEWDDAGLKRKYKYATEYPSQSSGITIDL